jgi:hypothetical protein
MQLSAFRLAAHSISPRKMQAAFICRLSSRVCFAVTDSSDLLPSAPCLIYHSFSACEIIIGLPEASKNMAPAFSTLTA